MANVGDVKETSKKNATANHEKWTGVKADGLRIGMYLQTENHRNKADFELDMDIAKGMDFDILVFPENCYFPGSEHIDFCFFNPGEPYFQMKCDNLVHDLMEISTNICKAIIFGLKDAAGFRLNFYVNANANEAAGETAGAYYVKHVMTQASGLGFSDYKQTFEMSFPVINYRGCKIGMTSGEDCAHAPFSRAYGLQGVDVILNSTVGDVVYDKWYKFNKARAIENGCYNFVTMGSNCASDKAKGYVYGFNGQGKEMPFVNNKGNSEDPGEFDTIYVFDTRDDDGKASPETSLDQVEKENKHSQVEIPVGKIGDMIAQAEKLADNLYVLSVGESGAGIGQCNLVMCVVNDMDIVQPEKVMPLMYHEKLKDVTNKRYLIVNKHQKAIDDGEFANKLSVILKVRSMENLCAVVLEAPNKNGCYQCANNGTVQVIAPVDGSYGIDLKRMMGPESIWKDKLGAMDARWRNNFEFLVERIGK